MTTPPITSPTLRSGRQQNRAGQHALEGVFPDRQECALVVAEQQQNLFGERQHARLRMVRAVNRRSPIRPGTTVANRVQSATPRLNESINVQFRPPLNLLVFVKAGSTPCIGWVS